MPGSPASGSAGSTARGMFATPAATSGLAAEAGRRDCHQREREGLPLAGAQVGRGSGGAGSRTAVTISPGPRATSERCLPSAGGTGRAAAARARRRRAARRTWRRRPRAPARGRTGAPRCSRRAGGCACGGRRSGRSRCRRRRASSATRGRGSTSSACAGRGCRRRCPLLRSSGEAAPTAAVATAA